MCKKLFENLDNADSIVSEIEFLSMHLFLIIICTIAEARLPLTGYFETRTFAMQLHNKCDQMVSTLKGKLTFAYVPTYLPSHVAACSWFWIVPNAVSAHARPYVHPRTGTPWKCPRVLRREKWSARRRRTARRRRSSSTLFERSDDELADHFQG